MEGSVPPANPFPALPVRPIRSAALANLGCKVNQSEMDEIERLLRAGGVRLVEIGEPADLVVVNTCAVTGVADQKSRHAVRRARRANPDALAFVTGCSVQLDQAGFAAALGHADASLRLFDNDAKPELVAALAGLVGCGAGADLAGPVSAGAACVAQGFDDTGAYHGGIARTRAFIKVQDGCSFHCTYCVVPRARGEARSLPADGIVGEVAAAVAEGHREIVLSGINIGTYGESSDFRLPGLIGRILDETDVERIRLSSIEPQHVTDDLLDVWTRSNGRCLPHFHVPLQSGDDGILRRMGRRYTGEGYAAVIERIRSAIPEAAIHADVMAGFPGEDDAAWANTIALIHRLALAGLHVFRFSARPGTPAERMHGQVDGQTKKRRSAEALALAEQLRAAFARRQLGRQLEVLFETRRPDGRWIGHADNYVEVTAAGGQDLEGAIATARADSVARDGTLAATVVLLRPRSASRLAEPIAVR